MPFIMASSCNFNFGFNQFLQYWLHMSSAVLFLGSIVIFFSILSNDVIKPAIFSVIAFFILAIPGLAGWTDLNVYRYMTGTDIFFTGKVNLPAQLVITGLGLLIIYNCWQVYYRKEF